MVYQLLFPLVLTLSLGNVAAQETWTYEGSWRTTNRKLDGTMTCVVTPTAEEQWRGRFYGVWQGVPFDYTVTFTGPPSDLRGTATIDGASYTWSGHMTTDEPRSFKGRFGGSRYAGYFNLRQKSPMVGGTN